MTVTTAEYHQLRADQMTEAQLQAVVTRAADIKGWRSYHTHDSRRSQPGFPDLVLIRGPRILFRELKTEKGRLRPEQKAWITDLETAGADIAVWRPIHWMTRAIEEELDQ